MICALTKKEILYGEDVVKIVIPRNTYYCLMNFGHIENFISETHVYVFFGKHDGKNGVFDIDLTGKRKIKKETYTGNYENFRDGSTRYIQTSISKMAYDNVIKGFKTGKLSIAYDMEETLDKMVIDINNKDIRVSFIEPSENIKEQIIKSDEYNLVVFLLVCLLNGVDVFNEGMISNSIYYKRKKKKEFKEAIGI